MLKDGHLEVQKKRLEDILPGVVLEVYQKRFQKDSKKAQRDALGNFPRSGRRIAPGSAPGYVREDESHSCGYHWISCQILPVASLYSIDYFQPLNVSEFSEDHQGSFN